MDSAIQPDSGDDSNQVEVPLASLTIDGQAPSVGDTCDFAIEARVTSINGEMAMVTPEKVNGQPVEDDEGAGGTDENDESAPSFNDNGDYQG